MKKFIGMKWGQLTEKEQNQLLINANPWECIEGDCIIDLTDELSVAGRVVVADEEKYIEIDHEAIIYNPAE